MNTVLITIAMAAGALPLSGADCLVLRAGQTVELSVSKVNSACFHVVVAANQADQLSLKSPFDLALQIRGEPADRLVDAFSFGRETATLVGPVRCIVTVRALSPIPAKSHVLMSRSPLPLQAARAWSHAEDLASRSKVEPTTENTLEALRAWEDLRDASSIARTRIAKGILAYSAGEYRDAIDNFEQARSLCKSLDDDRCVLEAVTDEGMAANRIGEYGNALQLTQDAVPGWRRIGDQLNLGMTLSNLGLIYWRTGDLQSGISASDQAVTILRNTDEVACARALNNLGLCYQVAAEYEQSASYFRRALEIFERHHNGAAVRARLNLGRTLYLSGDLRNARVLLDEAIDRAGKDPLAKAEAQSNLGQVLLTLHLWDAAGERLNSSLKVFQAMGDRRNEAAVAQYLGLLARDRGDSPQATLHFQQALAIRTALGLREDAADSLAALAELERDAGRIDSAREHVASALRLLESVRVDVPGPALRASFLGRKRSLFDLLVDLEAVPGRPNAAAAALLASERGRSRALLDQLADGRLLKQVPQDLELRRSQIQHRIDVQTAELGRAGEERHAVLRDQLRLLVSEDEAVEAQIRESVLDRNLAQPLQSVEQLQREALAEDSALLEYHLGERRSYLWLVQPAQVRMWSLPGRTTIEREVRSTTTLFGQIRERLTQPAKRTAFEKALQRLSVTLLSPLYKISLPPRLIVVSDVALLPVPFAALRIPGESRALGLEHEFVQAPSAGYLLAGNRSRPIAAFPKAILAFVDPVFSADDPRVGPAVPPASHPASTLSRLPFTAELDVATALVPPARRHFLRSFDASRSTLERVPVDEYAVVHLSTHAVIDDRTPELSRLALSLVDRSGRRVNGFLRPYQLARLRLPGSIVVLSACDTALGKQVLGEGMAGLANSLFYAGAGQLVLTLTQVDAEGSSQLLAETYRNLLGPRQFGMETALTLARRKLEASPRWHDPYYWASFIIIGRPSEKEAK